jgi:hypothetical protein
MKIENSVILITGGCSGIGEEMAKQPQNTSATEEPKQEGDVKEAEFKEEEK